MLGTTKTPRYISAFWWPAGVLIAGGVFAWLTARCYPFVIDDAFISFRYAANLAHGHGLVFNPGERVEGYTDFLWTVLIAAFMKVGIDPGQVALLIFLASSSALVV